MQSFTALGITIHIQNRTKERNIERERKSTLIVDTIFCMPRLGAVHALNSDQIYLILVMIFLSRYKLWFIFIKQKSITKKWREQMF
jgi:hypothetical protein